VKPIELLKLWSDLKVILQTLEDTDRIMVVREVLQGLPPAMTSQCPHTHELVVGFLRKELEETRGRRLPQDKPQDRPEELKAEVGTRQRKEKNRSNGVK
jgi:hypothetical protein